MSPAALFTRLLPFFKEKGTIRVYFTHEVSEKFVCILKFKYTRIYMKFRPIFCEISVYLNFKIHTNFLQFFQNSSVFENF